MTLIVLSPTGRMTQSTTSELYRVTAALARAHTGYAVAIYDDAAAITACHGNVGCLVSAVHTARADRYILILSVSATGDEKDRLTAILIDGEAALKLAAEKAEESKLFEGSVRAKPEPIILAEPEDVEPALAKIMAQQLQPVLGGAALGAIEVECALDGAELQLDGTMVGVTHKGANVIADVRAGKRQLRVAHPKYALYSRELDVEPNTTAKVTAQLIELETPADTIRTVSLWSGAGVAALGAVLAIVGILNARSDSIVCVGGGADRSACDAAMRVAVDRPASELAPNVLPEDGSIMLPLGVGMLIGGAAISGASLLSGAL